MQKPLMSFEEFKDAYSLSVERQNYPKQLRKGQFLMNSLYAVNPEEYKRITSLDYYGEHNIDCFYKDSLIENTLKHLENVWIDKHGYK